MSMLSPMLHYKNFVVRHKQAKPRGDYTYKLNQLGAPTVAIDPSRENEILGSIFCSSPFHKPHFSGGYEISQNLDQANQPVINVRFSYAPSAEPGPDDRALTMKVPLLIQQLNWVFDNPHVVKELAFWKIESLVGFTDHQSSDGWDGWDKNNKVMHGASSHIPETLHFKWGRETGSPLCLHAWLVNPQGEKKLGSILVTRVD